MFLLKFLIFLFAGVLLLLMSLVHQVVLLFPLKFCNNDQELSRDNLVIVVLKAFSFLEGMHLVS